MCIVLSSIITSRSSSYKYIRLTTHTSVSSLMLLLIHFFFSFHFPSLVSLLNVHLAISIFVSIQNVENLCDEIVCFSFIFYKSYNECEWRWCTMEDGRASRLLYVGEGDNEVGSRWCWWVNVIWCWDYEDEGEWMVSVARRMFCLGSRLDWREQRKIISWGVGRWGPLVFVFFFLYCPPPCAKTNFWLLN